MVRALRMPLRVELVAQTRTTRLSVVGVAAQVQALALPGIAERTLRPTLDKREGDPLIWLGVLVLVGIWHEHGPHVDKPQRRIVFPARKLATAEVQQVPSGVEQRVQLLEAT